MTCVVVHLNIGKFRQSTEFGLKSGKHIFSFQQGSFCMIVSASHSLSIYVMSCTIWYHLHNFKNNTKNIYRGVLLLVNITYVFLFANTNTSVRYHYQANVQFSCNFLARAVANVCEGLLSKAVFHQLLANDIRYIQKHWGKCFD